MTVPAGTGSLTARGYRRRAADSAEREAAEQLVGGALGGQPASEQLERVHRKRLEVEIDRGEAVRDPDRRLEPRQREMGREGARLGLVADRVESLIQVGGEPGEQ